MSVLPQIFTVKNGKPTPEPVQFTVSFRTNAGAPVWRAPNALFMPASPTISVQSRLPRVDIVPPDGSHRTEVHVKIPRTRPTTSGLELVPKSVLTATLKLGVPEDASKAEADDLLAFVSSLVTDPASPVRTLVNGRDTFV